MQHRVHRFLGKGMFAAILIVLLAMATVAFADDTVTILLDNEPMILSSGQPEIVDGRTFLPLRAISENLGMGVDYKADTKLVTISNEEGTLFHHTIGASFVTMQDDSIIDIGVESYIKDDRTMVSLRLFSNAMDIGVQWDGDTRTVSLATPTVPDTTPEDPDPTIPVATTLTARSKADLDQTPGTEYMDNMAASPIIIDLGAELIVLTARETLRDLTIFMVEYDEVSDAFYESGLMHYMSVLPADTNLWLMHLIPEVIPRVKIAYTNASGEKEARLLSWSGLTGDIVLAETEYNDLDLTVFAWGILSAAKASDAFLADIPPVEGEPLVMGEGDTYAFYSLGSDIASISMYEFPTADLDTAPLRTVFEDLALPAEQSIVITFEEILGHFLFVYTSADSETASYAYWGWVNDPVSGPYLHHVFFDRDPVTTGDGVMGVG